MILSAIALTFCMAMPQLSQATNVPNDLALIQNKDVKYTEITVDQIPEAVSKTVAKDFAGFKTDKAYKGEDGTFKLAVSKLENKMDLLFSADGKLLKNEKAVDLKLEKPASEKPAIENPVK